jgi:hypothetical protein
MDTTNLPKTRAEAKAQGAKYYFTGEPCKHGHISPRKTKGTCLECLKLEWERGNETRAEYFKAYNQSEAGQKAKARYYAANRDVVIARAMTRPAEDARAYRKKYDQKNPDLRHLITNTRRKRHREATPVWLDADQKAEIKMRYRLALELSRRTGEPYVVDHIVPLQGEVVCGLHVPWNLQVITKTENSKKSNKLVDPA